MATEDAKTSGGRSSEMMLAVTLGLLIFVGLGLLVAGGTRPHCACTPGTPCSASFSGGHSGTETDRHPPTPRIVATKALWMPFDAMLKCWFAGTCIG